MIELSRTIRFCLDERGPGDSALAQPRTNTYAGWPAMRGLGRYYELTVTCRGEVDPATGYFMNIKFIDEAVRDEVLPYLAGLIADNPYPSDIPLGELMQRMVNLLEPPLDHSVRDITLHLTPRYALQIESHHMSHVILRHQYQFCAAHRLHVPELSDEQNREVFGKCNNPAGHGHNYRLEVALRAPIADNGDVLEVGELDALVDRVVIQKLDHTHLNQDVPQFQNLNPSVENIARVIWDMLADEVGDLGPMPGERLEEVCVWETERTVCVYRGPSEKA